MYRTLTLVPRALLAALLATLSIGCAGENSLAVRASGPDRSTGRSTGDGEDDSPTLRFLALGDSYTLGEGVAETDRWPVQLTTRLRDEGIDLGKARIIAQTGWTTGQLLAGINRAKPSGVYQLVSLQIGVNNQYRGRGEAEYAGELKELLQRAVEFAGGDASRVLVLSIPDWGATPFARGRDREAIATEIDRFNSLKRQQAERLGCRYIDVTSVSRRAAEDRSLVVSDGLHPSSKMYSEWTSLALPSARRALGRKASH